MSDDDLAFFMSSYSLEHTKRYSMKPVVHQESVASHSFFVALAVLMLVDTYKFDVNKAVKTAICHDLAEMEISDVNHMVKKNFPAVAKALQDAEVAIVQSFPSSLQEYCVYYNDKSPESLVVHYGDTLQCMQYAMHEIRLGNRGYMVDVYDNSQQRLEALKLKLEPYRVTA